MNSAVVVVLIAGFFILVIGLLVYSVVIDQPRLRRKLDEESKERGWTHTAGKSLVVTHRSSSGYLVSPQETITESFEGKTQRLNWRIDAVAIARKYVRPTHERNQSNNSMGSTLTYHIIWHTEEARIERGSVLLFLKPFSWDQSENATGMVKAALQSVYSSLLDSILRTNWGIQSTTVTLDAPEFEAKYRVEASDAGAAKAALTAELRNFLVTHRPPNALVHLGDNGLHVVVSDSTYLRKFEKLVALADYGAELAQAVLASQSAAAPSENPDTTSSPAL